MLNSSRYEIVTTTAGATSILDRQANEIMHNPVGPWSEANALYVDQSKLKERLERRLASELVLFDVGLGAASNALAALHCARQSAGRAMKVVSFEKTLDLAEFALQQAEHFPHFAGWEAAVRDLLTLGRWHEGNLTWELRHGDFQDLIKNEREQAHLIYFDPYSPKVNPEMWSTESFRQIAQRSVNKLKDGDEGVLLLTYSQATPIRVALLEAGFYVGYGCATGLKEATTQAAMCLEDLDQPLNQKWLGRWQRSHMQFPLGHAPERESELRTFVLKHKQFAREIRP